MKQLGRVKSFQNETKRTGILPVPFGLKSTKDILNLFFIFS